MDDGTTFVFHSVGSAFNREKGTYILKQFPIKKSAARFIRKSFLKRIGELNSEDISTITFDPFAMSSILYETDNDIIIEEMYILTPPNGIDFGKPNKFMLRRDFRSSDEISHELFVLDRNKMRSEILNCASKSSCEFAYDFENGFATDCGNEKTVWLVLEPTKEDYYG